jgi:hypothetical protein
MEESIEKIEEKCLVGDIDYRVGRVFKWTGKILSIIGSFTFIYLFILFIIGLILAC